ARLELQLVQVALSVGDGRTFELERTRLEVDCHDVVAGERRCQCDKAGSRSEVENAPRIAAQPAENPRPFDRPIAGQAGTRLESLCGFDQAPAAGPKSPRGSCAPPTSQSGSWNRGVDASAADADAGRG